MNEQKGLDFGDEVCHRFEADAPGTWLEPQFTTAQYHALFTKATAALPRVEGLARELFGRGLVAACAEHAEMVECSGADDQPYRLWRAQCIVTDQEFDQFVDDCRRMTRTVPGDIEYKVRERRDRLTAAMYVRDLGTLVCWRLGRGHCTIDFRPWHDCFLLDSFRDHMPSIEAPYAAWAPAYCADKLAFADRGSASVPSVVVHGREYINTGMSGIGNYQECQAWTFCPVADWRGPTYNYSSQCRAYDNGSLERGDHRGLIVRVRGQVCVLDGATTIFDAEANASAVSFEYGEDYSVPSETALEEEDVAAH